MQAHDVPSAPSCTIASNFKPFLLLLFLFVGVWGYGQNPAQTITKAGKFKSHTVLTEKLDQKSLRKNSRGATQDINNKVVPKERKKSGVGETVYGPIQTNRQESPLEALKGKKEDLSKRAPAVPNDNCSGAISLTPSADNTCNATTGTTVGATESTQASNCSGNRDDDVWYSFVATSTNHDILATTPGSGSGGINDIVFEVFTSSGTCGTLVSLGCIDGTSGAGDEGAILTGATIGNTYYIRLYSFSVNGNQGVFNICVTTPVITTCEPTTDSPSESYINDVRFVGTLNDVSTLNSGYSNGYQDWTGEPKAIQAQGEGVNIIADAGGTRGGWKAWVDWNQDGNFDVGEEVYAPTGSIGKGAVFGFVIPPNQPIGDYTMRIRIGINFWDSNGNGVFDINEDFYYDFDSCEDFINTIFWGDADHYFGEAEDYKFTVIEKCESYVASTIDNERCGTGTLNLDVTGTGAAGVTSFNFYSAKTGGDLIGSQAAISNAATWTTPSINATTTYWVTATNGTCESTVRVPVRATINNTPADITFTPAAPILCGEDTIVEVNANSGTIEEFLIDEEFNSGLGVFSSINNDTNTAAVKAITRWQHQTSTLIPTGGNVWKPAIASGINNNGFAMATSDHNLTPKRQVDNSLTLTNSVNSTDFTSLFLNFDMFYLRYLEDNVIVPGFPEYVNIDISTNGGGAWITLETIRADYGYGSNFLNKNIDLIAYINQPDLKIRIRHVSYADGSSGWLPDGIAVDNIKLFGEKTVSDFEWDIPGVDVYTNPTADIAYTPGTLLQTVYIRPTLLQLETNPFTITANTGGSAACPSSGHLTLINNTKIYKSGATDWNTATNWSPAGVPTIDNCVIIPNEQTSIVDGTLIHAEAKNVTVKNGGILHLEPEYTLTVQDWINVENTGIFNIKNSASLIQINDLTTKPNSGNVHVQRAPKNDFSPVGNLNYVYWSSPVKNFNVRDISPNTSANLIWKWIPTITGNGSGNHGDWQNATGTMIDGTGYIVRGLSGTPTVLPPATTIPVSNNTALFTGVPNNGEIVVPINRGNYTAGDYSGIGNTATAQDDNWNLLGNPYPSSISANKFVNLNSHISGTIYLWPHTALPSAANDDPFYGDYGLNYDNIYIEHNPTGTIPPTVSDLNIASGQAFMVLMMDTAGLNETVSFNNSLRDKTQANNGFYRLENTTAEKHRIWLDFSGSDNKAHTLLVGYIENATNEYDRLYDGYNFVNNPTNFYSLIDESTFSIQGRAWPFTVEDTVPLGFTTTTSDIFKIGINTLDGLFQEQTQNIYLEDTYTGIIHDLKAAPYSFTSEAGSFNDRFILRYTNDTLSQPDEQALNSLLISAPGNKYIKVSSGFETIKSVFVYDVLGRNLFSNNSIHEKEFMLNNATFSNGAYIVKVTLSNGLQKTQKVILK